MVGWIDELRVEVEQVAWAAMGVDGQAATTEFREEIM